VTTEPKRKGGKREGAGRKKVERASNPNVAAKVLRDIEEERLSRAIFDFEFRKIGLDPSKRDYGVKDADLKASTVALQKHLNTERDRAYGRPVENSNVNHIHNKPIDMNVNVSLSERMRLALEKAEQRVSKRR
jgi:hypothetical protein